MDYKKFNEILANVQNLERKYTRVSNTQTENYYSDKDQGETGVRTEVYDLGFDSMFLKVVTCSDSYGNEQGISSIQFVQPKTKNITEYESV